MAATKKAATKAKATGKKAAPLKAAPKKPEAKAAPKKSAAKAAPAPSPAPSPDPAHSPAPKAKAAPKKAALLRLSDKQKDFLKKILESGESGYEALKAELRSIEGLVEKKLVKKGPKAKGATSTRYHLTKAGQKHSAPAPTATATPPTTA